MDPTKRSAKDIRIAPISGADARRMIARYHYSGKSTQNSQLHLGVFLDNRCLGALQFGPPMDKRRSLGLVAGTKWNNFLELNRMALSTRLPRNSESRALAMSMRLIRRNYPNIEWILTFADATQCGDGTIYRAAGFVLTGIKKNDQILVAPDGTRVARKTLDDPQHVRIHGRYNWFKDTHHPIPGFQLRYVYFLNPAARARLTVDVLPYSEIQSRGAGMYLGETTRKK